MWLEVFAITLTLAGGIVLAIAASIESKDPAVRRRLNIRFAIAAVIWLLLGAAQAVYVIGLLFGYDPQLPPDWVMASIGYGVVIIVCIVLRRWIRSAVTV